jgi:hypothetical protein
MEYYKAYLYDEYQSERLCKAFNLKAVLFVTKRSTNVIPVAIVSYNNCTEMLLKCHVTVQRYCQYNMLVTSVFRVFSGDVKKLN